MTEPTQAQIERACVCPHCGARGMFNDKGFTVHNVPTDAAPQVGETPKRRNDEAIIERCIQVIEEIAAVADEAQAEALRVAARRIRQLTNSSASAGSGQ